MVYEHSIERSLEVMRAAMPWMTRQSSATHPVSYAVWYEYVSGENPSLSHAVDCHLEAHSALDEAATHDLYERFIAAFDVDKARDVTALAENLLDGVTQSAGAMEQQAVRYGQALDTAAQRLAGSPVRTDLQLLIQETHTTADAVQTLQRQLAHSAREVQSLRAEVQRVRRDAMLDHLTGIGNLRAFEQRLDTVITLADLSGLGTPLCLIAADIDHFKRINDHHGHAVGDDVIRGVAGILRDLNPDSALAARVGGEEYAWLLPSTPVKQALVLAQMLRTQVGMHRFGPDDGPGLRVTISVGLACWRTNDTPRMLRERADQALYGAKRSGRDCVICKEV